MTEKTTEENEIVNNIKQLLGKNVLESEVSRPRRIFLLINAKVFTRLVRHLVRKLEFSHISTITGVDIGEQCELIYHLIRGGKITLSLRIRLDKDAPVLPTITPLIPGATLYEREVHDVLGVIFEGHPDLSRIILPEDWPQDVYPLRKEWTIEKIRRSMTKGGKS